MGVKTQGVAPRPRFDLDASDTKRSLTVSAKMLMCLLPEFDQVSVTVVDDAGGLTSWARAGDLVDDLDQLQYALGEGPCLDTLRAGRPVLASRIQHDDRWRRYAPAAARLGLRAQVATPVRWRDDTLLGALNMYSTTHAQIGFSAPLVAEVVAAQVASALASFREIALLDRALGERTVIGQATGLVMGRLEMDADHAFEYLRHHSGQHDRRLVQVAEDLVRTREFPSVRQA